MKNTNTPETDKELIGGCHLFISISDPHVKAKLARKLECERDELRAAIRNLRDVSGRHNSQIACERLFALIHKNVSVESRQK